MALCARSGKTGGDIAFLLEPDVPIEAIPDYSREQFIQDLLNEQKPRYCGA